MNASSPAVPRGAPDPKTSTLRQRLGVGSRTLAAVVGGYALAATASLALALSMKTPGEEGVYAATMPSFLVWALAVLWSFGARTALKAWLGILLPGVVLGAVVWLLSRGGVS